MFNDDLLPLENLCLFPFYAELTVTMPKETKDKEKSKSSGKDPIARPKSPKKTKEKSPPAKEKSPSKDEKASEPKSPAKPPAKRKKKDSILDLPPLRQFNTLPPDIQNLVDPESHYLFNYFFGRHPNPPPPPTAPEGTPEHTAQLIEYSKKRYGPSLWAPSIPLLAPIPVWPDEKYISVGAQKGGVLGRDIAPNSQASLRFEPFPENGVGVMEARMFRARLRNLEDQLMREAMAMQEKNGGVMPFDHAGRVQLAGVGREYEAFLCDIHEEECKERWKKMWETDSLVWETNWMRMQKKYWESLEEEAKMEREKKYEENWRKKRAGKKIEATSKEEKEH